MRRRTPPLPSALLAAAIVVAGCSSGEPSPEGEEASAATEDAADGSDAGAAKASDAAADPDEEPTGDAAVDDPAAAGAETLTMDREGHVIHEFADAPRVVEGGVRVGAVLLAIASLDAPDVAIPLEDPLPDTETVFGLQVVVINESDEPIVAHTDRGAVQVAGTTVTADTAASVPFGGELEPAGEDTGQTVWQLDVPFEQVLAAGGVTYTVEVERADGTVEDVSLPIAWREPDGSSGG